jgi:hypothetical protein
MIEVSSVREKCSVSARRFYSRRATGDMRRAG